MKKLLKLLLAILGLIAVAVPANALVIIHTIWLSGSGGSGNSTGPSSAGSAYWDVAKQGNYAYVANGSAGLQVIDVSNPGVPVRVGHLYTAGFAYGLAVSGSYAYVAEGIDGLEVIDISNPAAPISLRRYPSLVYPDRVRISGAYAFLLNSSSDSINIVNVSDPANCVQVGIYRTGTGDHPFDVALSGNYAYVAADFSGLQVVDARNPANWVLVGRLADYAVIGRACRVTVSANYAYVVDNFNGRLTVIDVSNPAAPVFAGSVNNCYGSVVVDGHFAYVGSTDRGLRVIDVSNPTMPTEVANLANIGWSMGIVASDNHLYVAADLNGLQVISLSNAVAPSVVGNIGIPGYTGKVAKSGRYVYVANGYNGLDVLDVNNASSPVRVGKCKTSDYTLDVALLGNYAYVADRTSLQVIDVRDPTAPVKRGSVSVRAYSVAGVGNYVYVASYAYYGGLGVIDVSNPSAPTIVATVDIPRAKDVVVSGNYAYVQTSDSGLHVLDLSNPAAPNQVGYLRAGVYNDSIAVSGNYFYMADSWAGLRVFSVANPRAPAEIGRYQTAYPAIGVGVSGKFVFIAEGNDGVEVIDVSDPAAPMRVSGVDTPGSAQGVAVSSGYAYVADGYEGLTITNTAPTISHSFSNPTINEDGTTAALAFTVGDAETAVASLTVTGKSSNTALVPDANIVFGGSGANRTVTVTPAANANSTATITLTVSDGSLTKSETFLLTVNAVNDAPRFVKGANQTVLEDAGAQTVPVWATGISKGPADEPSQAVNFIVSNNNNSLFSVQPAIAPNGTLAYTPAANANGTASVGVQLHDSGGTANGGIDTSAVQTFTVTVNAVNDPPSFVKGGNQTINATAGPQTVTGWATSISTGPANESGQALNFIIASNSNSSLFATQPAIASNGTLTYAPAAGANGTATIGVQLHDNGGTANGGIETSAVQTFTITVTSNTRPTISHTFGNPTINEDVPGGTGALAFTVDDAETAAGNLTVTGASSNTTLVPNGNIVFGGSGANRTVTVTPVANGTGTVTITLMVSDGSLTKNDTFLLTVNAVNDAPSFTKGADQLVNRESCLQTVPNWATGISAGRTNESGQDLAFSIDSNSNVSLFSVQPSVAANGTLTYTPAARRTGTATISLTLHDDGGTANGGIDTSAAQTFLITVSNLFTPLAGTYTGLIGDTAGYLMLTLTSSGTFSGRLIYDGRTYGLKGAFDSRGTFAVNIPRSGTSALAIDLKLDLSNTASSPREYSVTGTVDNVAVKIYHAAYRAGDVAGEASKYTILLKPTSADPSVPQGNGWARLTVANTGSVTMVTKLADNTALSATGPLVGSSSTDNQFILYNTTVYGGKGKVGGTITFASLPNSVCNGALKLSKPEQTTGSYYRDGFDTTPRVFGARYTIPPTNTPALSFNGGNGRVKLSDVSFTPAIDDPITLSHLNEITVGGANNEKLKITVTPATGVINGSFIHPVSHKITAFTGVLYQNALYPQAGGFYFSPAVNGIGHSGSITMSE